MISKLLIRENLLGEFQSILVLFTLVTALQKRFYVNMEEAHWSATYNYLLEDSALLLRQSLRRCSHDSGSRTWDFRSRAEKEQLYAPLVTPPPV